MNLSGIAPTFKEATHAVKLSQKGITLTEKAHEFLSVDAFFGDIGQNIVVPHLKSNVAKVIDFIF